MKVDNFKIRERARTVCSHGSTSIASSPAGTRRCRKGRVMLTRPVISFTDGPGPIELAWYFPGLLRRLRLIMLLIIHGGVQVVFALH